MSEGPLRTDLVARLNAEVKTWGGEGATRFNALAIEAAHELERLMNLIDYHNHGCQSACGFGELEGVRCGYRPYFPRRRCPECPTDWKIER